jgi:hypothetical protein
MADTSRRIPIWLIALVGGMDDLIKIHDLKLSIYNVN